MSRARRVALFVVVAVLVVMTAVGGLFIVDPSFAQSTTKALATNFTLVNFGASPATVAINYYKPDGSNWPADAANTNFTMAANGGQKIIRQYQDATMTAGQGSAIVSSDQPLGAVTQILASYPGGPAQAASSGAYSGIFSPADKWLVPLVARRGASASGTTNSQIFVQNAGSAAVNVEVVFSSGFTKSGISIQPGATFFYDLDLEAGLAVGFNGSAVVQSNPAGGQLAVVSNFWLGPDTLQTFNAFPSSAATTAWVIPLFTSRLTNGLSTPIAVQNVSGGSMAIGNITLSCTKDPASPGVASFNLSNTTAVAANASYFFNPVVAGWTGPTNWFGACRVTSAAGNVVAFVQMRYVGGTGNPENAAAHEAMPANGTNKKVFVPLVAKRLGNGFATAVTIVNLNAGAIANVTLNYTGSGASAGTNFSTATTIPAGGSLIQNQRLAGFTVGGTPMPDGWVGTLTVTSSNQAIEGFVQLTNILATVDDTFMAHNAFTQP